MKLDVGSMHDIFAERSIGSNALGRAPPIDLPWIHRVRELVELLSSGPQTQAQLTFVGRRDVADGRQSEGM
jgi:hypothetical protein